jgi:hypothetical protein
MVLDILKELKTCDENLVARIEFHDDILPFLSALQSHFTQLRLDDLKKSFYFLFSLFLPSDDAI